MKGRATIFFTINHFYILECLHFLHVGSNFKPFIRASIFVYCLEKGLEKCSEGIDDEFVMIEIVMAVKLTIPKTVSKTTILEKNFKFYFKFVLKRFKSQFFH